MRARDPDGIDSVWFALERQEDGRDGLLEPRFEARFTRLVPQGYRPGDPLELRLRARDVAGFSDTLWDSITVIP